MQQPDERPKFTHIQKWEFDILVARERFAVGPHNNDDGRIWGMLKSGELVETYEGTENVPT